MTTSEKALFGLIQLSLFGIPLDIPENIDWDAVFREAEIQTVSGLIPEIILPEEAQTWKNQRYAVISKYIHILHAQKELIELLKANGISMAILKGAAVAVYYPKPCCRTMGDVDLIVPQERFEETVELMKHNGYHVIYQENDPDERHIGFEKAKEAFELHHHFSYPDLDVEEYVTEGLEHTEIAEINGYRFPMLPPLANGLVLLAHMRSHLLSGMGLRQIIDWMMYVDKVLDDQFWENEFRKEAENIGLDKLAKTTTKMCQIYLGLNARITWCRDADDQLCERLMNNVLSSGNFGRKQGVGNQVEKVSTAIKKNGFFHYLQYAGEYNWNAYKIHKWLKPFCWIYQIGRYCQQGIKARRGKKLTQDLERGKERFHLMKQLNVI